MIDISMLISYCQRDPRWAEKAMPPSSLKLGRYGCTVTCLADLSTYFNDNLTPDQVVDKIKFTSGGLIIWSSCVFEHFEFVRREYGFNDQAIKTALFGSPDTAVILEVDHSHWVVVIGRDIFGRYRIADPWFGDKSVVSRYKQVTGAAYFKRH